MSLMASQITSLTIVYSTVYSGADQRKHQSSASLAFVRGIHRGPVNSPHKWPITRKTFPFDDVIIVMTMTTGHGNTFFLLVPFWGIPITKGRWCGKAWWRHQMEIFSALLALCAGNPLVTGEFPSQRPVTRSFDVFFDLCLNKRLSKQSCCWWFETPSRPLWRYCNGYVTFCECTLHT